MIMTLFCGNDCAYCTLIAHVGDGHQIDGNAVSVKTHAVKVAPVNSVYVPVVRNVLQSEAVDTRDLRAVAAGALEGVLRGAVCAERCAVPTSNEYRSKKVLFTGT